MQKAKYEDICHYNYKANSSDKYYEQGQSDHEPFYRMCIRTNQSSSYWYFQQLDVFTNSRWIEFIKEYKIPNNVNESHVRSTFTYRAFMNFGSLLKKQFKIRILQ